VALGGLLAIVARPASDAEGSGRDTFPPGITVARAITEPCFLDDIDFTAPKRVALPGGLREASGLAVLDGSRLLAHDDERAIVAFVDARTGDRIGQFSLGRPLPRDDFEGIAVLDGRVFLATSAGRLYETTIGDDGQVVPFRMFDTGLGKQCELEGMATDSASRSLLLSCKNPIDRALRGAVTVFAWSLDNPATGGVRFRAPVTAFRVDRLTSFRPSALEVLPRGDLLLLSGADRALAVVTPPDTVRCVRRLDPAHRQPEGIALLPDGSIVIADEGNPARLTFYHPRR
jgi:uncharacterized protein YjiK